MQTTIIFEENMTAYESGKSIIVNKGGTRSSKTWSILQLLFTIADISENPLIISVVSKSVPHLKKGCIRDFINIMQEVDRWDENCWNATDKIYSVNNSKIEFFSADQPGKVQGPARDILYINECIDIPFETYKQLAIRTRQTIFLDCNPCYQFWLDEHILTRDESTLIHSTYKDNPWLSETQIRELESYKHDSEWWKVYGEGLTGSKIGLVMQNWKIVANMPQTYKKRWLGMDFGYTNDPTAIIDIRLANGELYIDELLYLKGYSNPMIAKFLKSCDIPKYIPIIADSSEPKSINEIKAFGYNVEPAVKGADSIRQGISILNHYQKNITQRSLNIIKEYRNYRWKTDENGNPTNTPIEIYNHAVDAQRYVALKYLQQYKPIISKAFTTKLK